MIARALSATPWGIDAVPVEIEADVGRGLPQTVLVGLAETTVRESRERVRAAVRNCGFRLDGRSVIINLAPADLRKEGNHLDLAIALALLAAYGFLPAESLESRLACGELGLDGGLRPVRGALAIAELARSLGVRELLIAAASAGEAACLEGVRVVPVRDLGEAVEHLTAVRSLEPQRATTAAAPRPTPQLDLCEVRGQGAARRALEVAAAGGHNLLFLGPPGTGKTMLARRLPGILPRLTVEESMVVTKIRSVAGLHASGGLVDRRPFRSPHSTSSSAALIGGGSVPRPGEVTLAHGGVLFLDELPEFRRDVLEALRQPLEDGVVTVARSRATVTYPARFSLVAAMNPCPCGYLGSPRRECECAPGAAERYRRRISGPLLDRIDLHVELPTPALEELRGAEGEASATVASRVERARRLQQRRLSDLGPRYENARLTGSVLRQACDATADADRLVERAWDRHRLSARSLERLLRVARTIADLDGARRVDARHVAEALEYRALDRSSRTD